MIMLLLYTLYSSNLSDIFKRKEVLANYYKGILVKRDQSKSEDRKIRHNVENNIVYYH